MGHSMDHCRHEWITSLVESCNLDSFLPWGSLHGVDDGAFESQVPRFEVKRQTWDVTWEHVF